MSQRSGFYPRVRVDGAGKGVVSQAGGTLLTATIRATGLDRALSAALEPCNRSVTLAQARHAIATNWTTALTTLGLS